MSIEGRSTKEGWLLVLISSTSCLLGASIVFLGHNNQILQNKTFLSASMALGGGVLIFNSLYTLLPAAREKLNSDVLMFSCFFMGAFLTVLLTVLLQWLTPYAIHTCESNHNLKIVNLEQQQHHAELLQEPHDVNIISNTIQEQSVLLLINKPNQHISNHEYGSIMSSEGHPITTSDSNSRDKSGYFLIGIQTALAICMHKFPEGLIMFLSNESSSQLGLSVATAITIHNFVEGFLIALPLYYATGSKLAAFGYASFLGGISQPLGAVLGLLLVRNVIEDKAQEKFIFGLVFGIVSGMMCFIAIQSMLPQAIRANHTNHQIVPLFFFIGIFIIGLASLLQSSV